MIGLINDTLKANNKWSQKRLMTFSSFFVASIYAFIPIFLPNFELLKAKLYSVCTYMTS